MDADGLLLEWKKFGIIGYERSNLYAANQMLIKPLLQQMLSMNGMGFQFHVWTR